MARHVGCCQRFLAFRAKEMCDLKIPLLVCFVEYVKSEQFFLWHALGCSNFLLSCARIGVIFYCFFFSFGVTFSLLGFPVHIQIFLTDF